VLRQIEAGQEAGHVQARAGTHVKLVEACATNALSGSEAQATQLLIESSSLVLLLLLLLLLLVGVVTAHVAAAATTAAAAA
jgi:type II secretory pathway component PulL